MPRKNAKTTAAPAPDDHDATDLLAFWRQIVSGHILVEEHGTKKKVPVPIEVRIRASELLAKHKMPKAGTKQADDDDTTVPMTPDTLKLAQLLETKTADDLLDQAFAMIPQRDR